MSHNPRVPHWTSGEFVKLRALYPSAEWSEITASIPGRTKLAIQIMARKRRIYRRRPMLKCTGNHIIDVIRKRSRDLNINMRDLGEACQAKQYFLENYAAHTNYVNVKIIDRALKALGGKLQIVWGDC